MLFPFNGHPAAVYPSPWCVMRSCYKVNWYKHITTCTICKICDQILENHRYTQITQVIIASHGRQIKPQMDKSWASLCSLVHREYINLCFISIHERISKLQAFVYAAVMKEFTDNRFSVSLTSFLNTEACLGQKLYLGGCIKRTQ